MSLKNVVSACERPLTKAEETIVEILLSDPGTTSTLRATDVAQRAGVHEAAVTRLSKKLGYSGYGELRDDLRRDAGNVDPSPTREHLRESAGYDLPSLIRDEVRDLNRLLGHIPQEAVDAVAYELIQAGRVYVLGNPYAKTVMELLERRLRRLGVDAVLLSGTGRDLAEQLITWQAGDVLFVFALRKPPAAAHALLQEAARIGSGTVVLTDVMSLSLASSATHVLASPRGEPGDDSFRTMIVPSALCYAITQAVYHLDRTRADSALNRLIALARVLPQD